jgi:hypothetical protein
MTRKKPRMEKMERAMKRCIAEEESTSKSPTNNGIEEASLHCRDLKQSIFVTLHPKQSICIENDAGLGGLNKDQALYDEELLCNTILSNSKVLALSRIVHSI